MQDLEKQVRDENLSKTDDAKTKQEKLKALQLEIQMVQIEIQQEQAKAAKKSSQKQAQTNPATQASGQTDAGSRRAATDLLNQVA